ncbi:hypothetical protein A3715_29625 [Oleiphilus sp. HI0009]|nr:hypothetical protein A3715_11345 [Oleiphilus sp. HI0009]KZX84558.1 hypothetical protein A3715_29625 [Oleiphilus sp. HI0009]
MNDKQIDFLRGWFGFLVIISLVTTAALILLEDRLGLVKSNLIAGAILVVLMSICGVGLYKFRDTKAKSQYGE